MGSTNEILGVILSVLGAILLVVAIILLIRVVKTMNKIDKILDDVEYKMSKLNNIFNIIDTTTDAIAIMNDKVVGSVVGIIQKIFSRKKNKEEEQNND